MILSRVKSDSASSRNSNSPAVKKTVPDFEEFLLQRDYTGARTVLEFRAADNDNIRSLIDQWTAFCNFHLGDYAKALEQYQSIRKDENTVAINVAVCMFYLGIYQESQELIETIPNSPLKVRLLFHLSHKLKDEERLLELHGSLRDVSEDQLSLAGLHFLRGHYQEAIDIYKRVQLDKKDFLALNIYIALCYYKLDYFDISQEVLDMYLTKYPDSIIAINLKACNRFRLFDRRTAELDIKNLISNSGTFGSDLIKHNLVVFRGGEGALQVFPMLIDIVPEARLNLAIYYLRGGDVSKAEDLMKDVQPSVSYEYILKGAVHAVLGHAGSKEHLKNAQQYLHLVGSSAAECDTIPGRQSMASAFFLYGQFEEVLVYLNSIRSYFVNDDTFNYNYAQAKAATGYYAEAEEILMQISDPEIRHQHTYGMVLSRCHINCGHAEQAWNIYVSQDNNTESYALLQLIANESYRTGEFWISAKAFDMLEKLDPNPEHWEGKRGAIAGSLLAIVKERTVGAPPEGITAICSLLRDSTNSQAETMLRSIRRYASLSK
ncbi:intraflagellar transport protein 56 [Bradysia coprophila]|uniref:intraflagellar transport protein 56 n=1 Tax=Bradysia coprophila TaxID=38358 RepID=UPI00187D900A|nr:intraflagellar transport protein 56 [Bradysia coprophila]